MYNNVITPTNKKFYLLKMKNIFQEETAISKESTEYKKKKETRLIDNRKRKLSFKKLLIFEWRRNEN